MSAATVPFEVLFRTPGAGRTPTLQNVNRFRPDPESLGSVLHWLEAHGAVARATGFSLACSAPPAVFEAMFGVRVHAVEKAAGVAAWKIDGPIRLPPAIAELVEDVTLSRPPELF
jgi:hypothetical protein